MPQINCRRFAAEEPKKVQNVFIFWSPESTEKREKPNRRISLHMKFVKKEVLKSHTKLEIFPIDFARGGVADFDISYMDEKR